MSFINKPKVGHPSLPTNALGLTRRQYEGSMSTLCAGCGHDSVTAAIIEACWGLDMRPEMLVKLSGIGCSSKTTSYFVSGAHGFNSVHGRMPSIASGANAANRDLTYVGVSGDGDSLSIGLGQLVHAIRRNVNMLYVIENNGVYGLTKGQFSAAAYEFIEDKLKQNEYVTGLIHIDEAGSTEFHTLNNTSAVPLNRIPYEKLSPGRAALEKLMGRYR